MKIAQIDRYEKIGINEVIGLKAAMLKVMLPIVENLEKHTYWLDSVKVNASEYKSRDGFIPYSSNCGGLEIVELIPKSSEHDFDFLRFGEYDCTNNGCTENECTCDSEGYLDAKLRIWLKFEGIENGVMSFYLYLGGGNFDAPYFRTTHEVTVFEGEFKAKSLVEFNKKASVQVKKLLKAMGY